MSEYSLVEIFCKLDDFYEKFEIEFSKKMIEDGSQKSKSGIVFGY